MALICCTLGFCVRFCPDAPGGCEIVSASCLPELGRRGSVATIKSIYRKCLSSLSKRRLFIVIRYNSTLIIDIIHDSA